MPKTQTVSKQNRNKTITKYVKQGYSANKIQKLLQKQKMGMQRKKLLAEIRSIKGQKSRVNTKKYTPKKYRKKTKKQTQHKRASPSFFGGKSVAVYRSAKTKRHPKPYSARFEFHSSSGKYLQKVVITAFKGVVPPYEQPFVQCSAKDFVEDPFLYGEKGVWTGKPNVES